MKRLLVSVLVAASLLHPASPASGAEGPCGSGYYKQGDGLLSDGDRGEWVGNYVLSTQFEGKVRYCLKDISNDIDYIRRVVIAHPQVLRSSAFAQGRIRKLCLRTTVTITAEKVVDSTSWSVGLSGVDATESFSDKSATIKFGKICVGKKKRLISFEQDDFTVTLTSGEITGVEVRTDAQMRYSQGSSTLVRRVTAQDRDIPN